MTGFRYARPPSVESAIGLLTANEGEAYLLAGGTALALLLKQDLLAPGVIIDLGAVPGLEAVDVAGDGSITIGALTTLRDVSRNEHVQRRAPALASTVARVATVRIRNQATLGGNLAHGDPAQDPPPMLMALGAEVVVQGPAGERRVPVDEFFVDVFETVLGPTDVLTSVRVPPLPDWSAVAYEKFLPRTSDDYATVSVALRLDWADDGSVQDGRLVLGAVGPVPIRAVDAESLLKGRSPADVDLDAVAVAVRDAVDPVSDVRGSADYKREMAGVLASRAVGQMLAAAHR
jgi:carbon-monoxide dehydrogenase medium subunit